MPMRHSRGASLLPPRYRAVRQQRHAGARFEQITMAKHNQTRYTGLENDIANCYANALVQVLRAALPWIWASPCCIPM